MARSALYHDSKDWEIAGRTLFGEARGEPWEGMVGVAWVIRNRAATPSWWGRDVKGVCLAPFQFSCWRNDDPNSDRIKAVTTDEAQYRRCLSIISLVLTGDIPDPTDGSTHYFTVAKPSYATVWPPIWSKSLKETVVIGAHRFMREFRAEERKPASTVA